MSELVGPFPQKIREQARIFVIRLLGGVGNIVRQILVL